MLRDAAGLAVALDELKPLREHDAGLVATLLVGAALRREESRGGHTRTDFPQTAETAEHLLSLPGDRVDTALAPVGGQR